MFLGRSFSIVPPLGEKDVPMEAVGKLPQSMIEEELSNLISWHKSVTDIVCIEKFTFNR